MALVCLDSFCWNRLRAHLKYCRIWKARDLSLRLNLIFLSLFRRFQLQSTPNDPRYGDLYGLHNTGQSGGTIDADIDAPEAWQVSTGSRDIIVGVVDTGIDYTHP